jgi:hypothetical protein
MTDGKGRSLTRAEFDSVIRRAAELSSSDPEASEGALSESELFRIAGEVGLDEGHVRRALAEVRAGAPPAASGSGVIQRVFGPAHVRVSRVVPGTPDQLAQKIDDYMVSTQLLQRVRRGHAVLQYRPAADWASQVARAAGMRKYYIASAKTVEVQLDTVEAARTLVTFTIEPGTRGNDVTGAIVGGAFGSAAAGTGTAIGAALLLTSGTIPIVVGVAVGTGVWSAIFFGTGAAHRKKLEDVRVEAEGVLDALETGTSLEPPPPAWRKWVKRHFHGVARDILGEEERAAKRSEP